MIATMSRSEVLERARAIRASAPADGAQHIFPPDESAILEEADRIVGERRASGIEAIVDTAIAAVRGERVAAERKLEMARRREADIEEAIRQQAANADAIKREKEALGRLHAMMADFERRTTPEAEGEAMTSRWHFRHDPRFAEHLPLAVQHIQNNRLIATALPLYLAKTKAEIDRLESEGKVIAKKIARLQK
jgi:hypothetical protein